MTENYLELMNARGTSISVSYNSGFSIFGKLDINEQKPDEAGTQTAG
jgi:hypothetical protein